jgi:hypothetical protein
MVLELTKAEAGAEDLTGLLAGRLGEPSGKE